MDISSDIRATAKRENGPGPSRPQRLICSRRSSYIPATVTVPTTPLDVFFQMFLLMLLTDFTMHSHFSFKIRKVPRVHH